MYASRRKDLRQTTHKQEIINLKGCFEVTYMSIQDEMYSKDYQLSIFTLTNYKNAMFF